LYLSLSPFLSLGNKERNARERLVAACPKWLEEEGHAAVTFTGPFPLFLPFEE
jgi:hypothetical protein